MPENNIAIVSAVSDEIKEIKSRIEVDYRVQKKPFILLSGKYKGKQLTLSKSGIGGYSMQEFATYLFSHVKPSFVLHVGYCGGADPRVSTGDLVIASTIKSYMGPESIEIEKELLEKAEAVGKKSALRYHVGVLATVAECAHKPHDKAFVGATYGALAMDMESFFLARAARKASVPIVVARAVIDPMEMELPQFGKSMDIAGDVNGVEFTESIIKKPKNFLEFSKLGYLASQARGSITKFVDAWIEEI